MGLEVPFYGALKETIEGGTSGPKPEIPEHHQYI